VTAFGTGHASVCPCGSGEPYAACCGPLLRAEALAQTAEELMRSRYTAYALGDVAHLLRTWHPRTRPTDLDPDGVSWNVLSVLKVQDGGPDDATGIVEFVASWSGPTGAGHLHEASRFERRAGRWFYLDGDIR
jgi:SEC-C motif-containing protein